MKSFFRLSGIIFLINVLILCGCGDSQASWEQLYHTDGDDTAADARSNGSDIAIDAEPNGDDTMDNDLQGTQENEKDTENIDDTEQPQAKEQTKASVFVYVCGAVVSPGVYELPAGARIVQAIEAAGGLTEDADSVLVNQAKIVEDGEQIRIYTKEEAQEAETQRDTNSETAADSKVNINTASAEVLMTLSGIGKAKAEAIIQYRKENGSFKTIEDIMNIPGIKEAVFSKIRDRITV